MVKLNTIEREYCSRNGIDPADYLQNTAPADREKIKAEMESIKEDEKKDLKVVMRKARIEQYPDWVSEPDFIFDEKGKLLSNYHNDLAALTICPAFKDSFSFDEYKQLYLYKDSLTGKEMEFSDALFRTFYDWFETQGLYSKCEQARCREALMGAAEKRTYNSAKNFFDGLMWDGVPRLETFFIDLYGVQDTPLVREMTKRWLVGAIQRIYEPGCQNDNVLILTGPQGSGKSSTLKWLTYDFGFNDAINISSNVQEYGQKLENCWFCCFDELATLGKRESAIYKNWLSIREDKYRAPYDKMVKTHPRHNVYCGTTNEKTFLKDHSDDKERRMWVLKCNRTSKEWKDIYRPKLTADLRNQLWAEAMYIYKNTKDFSPYLDSRFEKDFIEHQKQFKDYNSDNIADMLIEILNRPYHLNKNGHFKSQDDMLKQIHNGYTFRPKDNDEVVGFVNYISHSAVKRILTEVLKTKRGHDYMKNALDGIWCVKNKQSREGSIQGRYYVRGQWVDKTTEEIERRPLIYTPPTTIPDNGYGYPDMLELIPKDTIIPQYVS